MEEGKLLKISKTLVLVYLGLSFLNVLLPDENVIGIVRVHCRLDPFQMLIRWFNFVGFIVLPIAVFYDKPTFKRIAVYFSLPVVIIFMCMYDEILAGYISERGTGIVDIRYLPEFISNFMRNGMFRSTVFFGICLTEIAVIVLLVVRDLNVLKFNKEEVGRFFIILTLLIFSVVPIYALEGIFNTQTNIAFKFGSIPHLLWIVCIGLEIFVLYRVFKNKSQEDKHILILVLSIALLLQYNQLFSSLGELTCKRMPLQLCNLASYLILVATITKNRSVFLFNLLVNVAGGIIAVIILDADNSGILGKGNVHYIVEHNNVIVTPILSLMLGEFKPLKKTDFKVFLKWYTVYFVIIFILGTTFNAIYTATGSDYFRCNYLFMFDAKKAEKLIPFTKYLFRVAVNIGPVVIYPILQPIIYIVFSLIGYLSFIIFRKTIKEPVLEEQFA